MAKLQNMIEFMPNILRPSFNPMNRGILNSFASEDDKIVSAIRDAKEQLFVLSAQGRYLDVLGSNVGFPRPTSFKLIDDIYRSLIPVLSFWPKQVRPTIKMVLDIFFENDSRVYISEVSPNQINIRIPYSVPFLRRGLRGSFHIHNYYGEIISVDNTLKEMTVNVYGGDSLDEDELKDATIGQKTATAFCLSSSAGTTSVLQFGAGEDLSAFQSGNEWVASKPNYPSAYLHDSKSLYSVTEKVGFLGQNISAGAQLPSLLMSDASKIDDSVGYLVFNFGHETQEAVVKYFGRPNNQTLLLDVSHVFSFDHFIGEPVNMILKPSKAPNKDGSDYSVYLTGATAARILAQRIVESIVAAGVIINWDIIVPEINC